MKPFKLEERTYEDIEALKRELLAETIEGCIYMMFLNQPKADFNIMKDALTWYTGRLSLFVDSLEMVGETEEEKQVVTHLKDLTDYIKSNIQEVASEIKRREITRRIVNEIAPIVRGLKRKQGTIKDSYNERFLLDYSSKLLAHQDITGSNN